MSSTPQDSDGVRPVQPALLDSKGVCAFLSICKRSLDNLCAESADGDAGIPRPLALAWSPVNGSRWRESKRLWRRADLETWIAMGCPRRSIFEKRQAERNEVTS